MTEKMSQESIRTGLENIVSSLCDKLSDVETLTPEAIAELRANPAYMAAAAREQAIARAAKNQQDIEFDLFDEIGEEIGNLYRSVSQFLVGIHHIQQMRTAGDPVGVFRSLEPSEQNAVHWVFQQAHSRLLELYDIAGEFSSIDPRIEPLEALLELSKKVSAWEIRSGLEKIEDLLWEAFLSNNRILSS